MIYTKTNVYRHAHNTDVATAGSMQLSLRGRKREFHPINNCRINMYNFVHDVCIPMFVCILLRLSKLGLIWFQLLSLKFNLLA